MTDAKVAEAKSFLPYKSVDIYFIFSFVLEHLGSAEELIARLEEQDLRWSEGPPDDRKGRPPFLHIKTRVGTKSGSDLRAKTHSKRLCRTPTTLTYEERDHRSKELVDTDTFEVEAEAWARLFDNGAGCITFRIRLDEHVVSFRRVYEALSLSQRLYDRKESYASVKLDGRDGNLFAHFRTLLAELVEEINASDAKEEHPIRVRLQDEEIMAVSLEGDGTAMKDDGIDAQNPYVLTVVELDEESPYTQFLRDGAVNTLQFKELAAILFRLVYPFDFFRDLQRNLEFVRIPPELLVDGLHLRNFAWDSRSLMCFSKTSSLFACVNKYGIPAVLIRYSLLDTLEVVRTRWHMSIVINAQLDQDLESFRSEASQENLKVLARLNQRRKRFAAYLHDPLPYSFEGGSVAWITEVAAHEMELANLRRMTLEKFATLDKLHADQMKLAELQEFDKYIQDLRAKDVAAIIVKEQL